jgi:hypothetical protein
MIKRACVLSAFIFVLVLSLACPVMWAQGSSSQPPVFTYVAEWHTPRAQWADMEKVEATTKSTMDGLVADGTIIGYGSYVNRIHSEEGPTHGSWFSADSLANIFKALDKIYAQPGAVSAPAEGASKHWDFLMISTTHGAKAYNGPGYLRVVSGELKPGRGDEFRAAYRQYIVPIYEKLLAEGAIVAYQLDGEYVMGNAPGRFFSAVLTKDAEGLDKLRTALADMYEKNPAVAEMLTSTGEPNSRRDLLAHVTSMVHK